MSGCSYTDVQAICGKLVKFAASGGDYTSTEVTNAIGEIVKREVAPVFRRAGYLFPADYPTTQASSVATENTEIDQMIALLVSYRLAKRLPRYDKAPAVVEEWGDTVLGNQLTGAEKKRGWLDTIKKGVFTGITTSTARTSVSTPIVSDTTTMFPDMDAGDDDEDHESSEDDW